MNKSMAMFFALSVLLFSVASASAQAEACCAQSRDTRVITSRSRHGC